MWQQYRQLDNSYAPCRAFHLGHNKGASANPSQHLENSQKVNHLRVKQNTAPNDLALIKGTLRTSLLKLLSVEILEHICLLYMRQTTAHHCGLAAAFRCFHKSTSPAWFHEIPLAGDVRNWDFAACKVCTPIVWPHPSAVGGRNFSMPIFSPLSKMNHCEGEINYRTKFSLGWIPSKQNKYVEMHGEQPECLPLLTAAVLTEKLIYMHWIFASHFK